MKTHVNTFGDFSNIFTYIRLIAVLFLRAGYVLIQIGNIPVNDIYSIILHNILDITVTLSSYGLLGYMFSFGENSLGGFIGSTTSFYSTQNLNSDEIIFGFSACLISSAVLTTMLAGRLQPVTAAGISFFYCGFLQPIVMHWSWHKDGWMAKRKFYKIKLSLKDYAGGLTVHLTSGVAALCGTVCLGRRLLKLKDVHESSLGNFSPGTSFIGYTFVFIGLISFSLPTTKYELQRIPDDYIGIILLNNTMAFISGLMVVLMQCFCFGNTSGHWILLKSLQGCIAGLVIISGGVDIYDHVTSFFIATFGGILFYITTLMNERLFYEDYCNIVPSHLICGFFGAIFPPLFGNRENLGPSITFTLKLTYTGWQLFCGFTIFMWTLIGLFPLFVFLRALGLLADKNEELNHQRSVNLLRNIGNPKSIWRIFTFSEFVSPFIEPGSSSKCGVSLEKIKERYESRRELLENAMARKMEKKKMTEQGKELQDVSRGPVVAEDVLVKNMGILEEERYPVCVEEVMEKNAIEGKFISTASNTNTRWKNDENDDKKSIYVEMNKNPYKRTKLTSPRRKVRTTRRRRKLKRSDSTYNR